MYFNLWNKGAYEGMCGVIRPVLTAESQLPKTFGGATFPLNIQYDSVFKLFQLLTTVDDHAVIYSDPVRIFFFFLFLFWGSIFPFASPPPP